jgi:hypothetical protein
MSRNDPVGRAYYAPMRNAEVATDVLFYLTAVLSLLALLVPASWGPYLVIVQTLFPASTLALFVISTALRLFWAPRAQEKRAADLLANSFGVAITDEISTGFFNNDETDHFRKLNASVMENSFFGTRIVGAMLRFERAQMALYVCGWTIAVLFRSSDLALLTVAAQALWSEQVLSRWLRMEFLRGRLERTYDKARAIATAKLPRAELQAKVIESLTNYEVWKAQAAISQSSRLFHKLNPTLSIEWDKIRSQLGIA